MLPVSAYIIAARRSALGRIGGIHKWRRVEELSAPVIAAALADCGVKPREIDEIIVGNASEGGNPARLIALTAGMAETCAATTVDRQCGSGLEAILSAIRLITCGDAEVVVAGGAESISNAPWRIAKPKSLYQIPHFMRFEPGTTDYSDEPQQFEASEQLSRKLGLSRGQLDAWAMKSHMKATTAREKRRFVGEIVPIRSTPEEARDQSAIEPGLEDLEKLSPFLPPDGTLTPGNTSAMHDGAAFAVLVSEAHWVRLGRPTALKLVTSAAQGVSPDREGRAPAEAFRKMMSRINGLEIGRIGVVELSESSAAQALAFGAELGIDPDIINPDGGAVVRGHPFGAAGAVLVTRLFTRMTRGASQGGADGNRPTHGVAVLGTMGGMGLAALFEVATS
ncbi:MAG: acetyl-CoA C-acyltransferase [Hyphomicrobium sp.]|nr:acetyl-CoA C-acyltransferase [Hyphomicrobium sp.]